MKPWTYESSPALRQNLAEQLTTFPRERDMTHAVLRMLWTVWLRLFLHLYFRLQLIGRERVPKTGSYVLVANHASHLDAVALSAVVPWRSVHRAFAAAAKDYFFSSFWRSLFSAVFVNAVPFDRTENKRESLELCADLLDVSDRVLIMFPEGTRSVTGEIQPFKKGVGILTAGTDRSVVPIYIEGAYEAWPKGVRMPRPKRVRVIIGEPMNFSHVQRTEEGYLQVARQIETAVRRLREQCLTHRRTLRTRLTMTIAKVLIRTIGRTSHGIRMCFDYGLTSGKTVDYVYRNRPSGRWLIGKAIDRRFLANPGWEAVRIRRRHLEQLLLEAIAQLRKDGRLVSLLDIASGPALYVLSVLEQVGEHGVYACCRDFDERWLRDGEAEASRRNLKNVHFEQGDAFNRDGLLAIRPRPNLAVSSGFYDWINEDDAVRRSLAMLFEVLEPGGFLVVTNQIAHPNLEFVSAVFVDFKHEPLRMTMRPAHLIHAWLEEVGFVVARTLTDSWGYYSVMKARKP